MKPSNYSSIAEYNMIMQRVYLLNSSPESEEGLTSLLNDGWRLENAYQVESGNRTLLSLWKHIDFDDYKIKEHLF